MPECELRVLIRARVHILGARNVTVSRSVFEYNGNGNAYFHNAYFLRVVGLVVADSAFTHSTGTEGTVHAGAFAVHMRELNVLRSNLKTCWTYS